MKYFILALSVIVWVGCSHDHKHEHKHGENHGHSHPHEDGHHHHGEANEHMHKHDFKDLVQRFESPERDAYQKPEEVMDYLGDLTDKTVLEIGAGTGYFSFRLHEAGAHVIAADVDERFQEYIRKKRDSLGIESGIELRQVPYDSPKMKEGEADMVMLVNTYHHIENRSAYFKKVFDGLTQKGEVVIIDFFKKELPLGPPPKMKLTPEEVISELEAAGFTEFEVEDKMLEYQYIVTASK